MWKTNIWLMERLTINYHTGTACAYYIARYSNNAFDKISSGVQRIVKDNNIPAFGSMKKIGYFVYQYILIGMQTRFHAFSIYTEALSRESDYQKYQ